MSKNRKKRRSASRAHEPFVVQRVSVYDHGQPFSEKPRSTVSLDEAEEWERQGAGEFHRNKTVFQLASPRSNAPEAGNSVLGESFIMAYLEGQYVAVVKLSMLKLNISKNARWGQKWLIPTDKSPHTKTAAA